MSCKESAHANGMHTSDGDENVSACARARAILRMCVFFVCACVCVCVYVFERGNYLPVVTSDARRITFVAFAARGWCCRPWCRHYLDTGGHLPADNHPPFLSLLYSSLRVAIRRLPGWHSRFSPQPASSLSHSFVSLPVSSFDSLRRSVVAFRHPDISRSFDLSGVSRLRYNRRRRIT